MLYIFINYISNITGINIDIKIVYDILIFIILNSTTSDIKINKELLIIFKHLFYNYNTIGNEGYSTNNINHNNKNKGSNILNMDNNQENKDNKEAQSSKNKGKNIVRDNETIQSSKNKRKFIPSTESGPSNEPKRFRLDSSNKSKEIRNSKILEKLKADQTGLNTSKRSNIHDVLNTHDKTSPSKFLNMLGLHDKDLSGKIGIKYKKIIDYSTYINRTRITYSNYNPTLKTGLPHEFNNEQYFKDRDSSVKTVIGDPNITDSYNSKEFYTKGERLPIDSLAVLPGEPKNELFDIIGSGLFDHYKIHEIDLCYKQFNSVHRCELLL